MVSHLRDEEIYGEMCRSLIGNLLIVWDENIIYVLVSEVNYNERVLIRERS